MYMSLYIYSKRFFLFLWYVSTYLHIWSEFHVWLFACSFSCIQGNGCLHCKHTYFYTEVLASLLYMSEKHCLIFLFMSSWSKLLVFFIYILNNNTAVVNFSPVNSFSGVVIADGVLQNNVHFERHGMHHLPPEMYFCFSVHNFLGSKLIL